MQRRASLSPPPATAAAAAAAATSSSAATTSTAASAASTTTSGKKSASSRRGLKKRVTDVLRTSVDVIVLDVGGVRFKTSMSTLQSVPESMLGAMFSGRFELSKQADGSFFIDRDGRLFGHVLNWLRDRTLPVGALSADDREALRVEANFYHLPELASALDDADEADSAVKPDLTRMDVWRFYAVNQHNRNFRGLCLRGLDLSYFDLTRADFTGADFSEANLSHCNLSNANMTRCTMRGASLRDCDLRKANLAGADLRQASLHSAQLHEANLSNANFADAVLTNANFTNANLTNANLSEAKFKRLSTDVPGGNNRGFM
jgi:uncharacterized protein YjbI with pentapeptide repeats